MAYDAARGEVVLFGGYNGDFLGDTWTWDGTTWSIPFEVVGRISPQSGPPGTAVDVGGRGFAAYEVVKIFFIDSVNGRTLLGSFTTDASGTLRVEVTIPLNATPGTQVIVGTGMVSGQRPKAKFTVT